MLILLFLLSIFAEGQAFGNLLNSSRSIGASHLKRARSRDHVTRQSRSGLTSPFPGRPSSASTAGIPYELERETSERTAYCLLYRGTGMLGYAMGLRRACTMPVLSQGWFCSLPVLVLASYAIARSMLPFANMGNGIDVSDDMFARNLGAHIFSATAIPILSSLELPLFNQVQQKLVMLFSMGLMVIGSISEIMAHFKDAWVFKKGCNALDGSENAVFWVGLCGGFSFFAAAFSPNVWSLSLASIPPLFLIYLAATKPWHKVKGLTIATQTLTTIALSATVAMRFRSKWPLLFFVQSLNIVRNSSRIIATENQNLHLLPSVYGWFSYIFPFAFSLHKATQTASLLTVLSFCALTIIGSDIVERRIIDHTAE